ncbi:MAG: hypothetical protein JKY50_22330 [Oleispira sp.]|nr:hypothetical protein [Oleispira sp.]
MKIGDKVYYWSMDMMVKAKICRERKGQFFIKPLFIMVTEVKGWERCDDGIPFWIDATDVMAVDPY